MIIIIDIYDIYLVTYSEYTSMYIYIYIFDYCNIIYKRGDIPQNLVNQPRLLITNVCIQRICTKLKEPLVEI